VASARGRAYLNDCVPYCARGHFHRWGIRLRVYRRVYCPAIAAMQYTRLSYTFVGRRRPPYAGERGLRFPCGGV
jgi:hypothetical protein